MTSYCTYCGSPLPEDGSPCPCPYAQRIAAPPDYPYLKPAKPRGISMIFVTGILLTVFGSIVVLLDLFVILIGAMMGTVISPIYFIELLANAASLGFGIYGIRYAADQARANNIVVIGIVLIILKVIYTLIMMNMFVPSVLGDVERAAFMIGMFLGLLFSCVLPVLYIVGGNIRKNAPE